MPSRLSPTEKIRAEIEALFGSGRDLSEVLENVARLGARLIMQAAVEADVEEFLGRARYQRQAEEAGTHEQLLRRQRDYWSLYMSGSSIARGLLGRRGQPDRAGAETTKQEPAGRESKNHSGARPGDPETRRCG